VVLLVTNAQHLQVAVLPFATPFQLRKELDQVTEWILTLTSADKQKDNINSNLKLARYTSKNEDISNAIKKDNEAELASLLKEGSRVRIYPSLQLLNY
jgi:hypothetical protein